MSLVRCFQLIFDPLDGRGPDPRCCHKIQGWVGAIYKKVEKQQGSGGWKYIAKFSAEPDQPCSPHSSHILHSDTSDGPLVGAWSFSIKTTP